MSTQVKQPSTKTTRRRNGNGRRSPRNSTGAAQTTGPGHTLRGGSVDTSVASTLLDPLGGLSEHPQEVSESTGAQDSSVPSEEQERANEATADLLIDTGDNNDRQDTTAVGDDPDNGVPHDNDPEAPHESTNSPPTIHDGDTFYSDYSIDRNAQVLPDVTADESTLQGQGSDGRHERDRTNVSSASIQNSRSETHITDIGTGDDPMQLSTEQTTIPCEPSGSSPSSNTTPTTDTDTNYATLVRSIESGKVNVSEMSSMSILLNNLLRDKTSSSITDASLPLVDDTSSQHVKQASKPQGQAKISADLNPPMPTQEDLQGNYINVSVYLPDFPPSVTDSITTRSIPLASYVHIRADGKIVLSSLWKLEAYNRVQTEFRRYVISNDLEPGSSLDLMYRRVRENFDGHCRIIHPTVMTEYPDHELVRDIRRLLLDPNRTVISVRLRLTDEMLWYLKKALGVSTASKKKYKPKPDPVSIAAASRLQAAKDAAAKTRMDSKKKGTKESTATVAPPNPVTHHPAPPKILQRPQGMLNSTASWASEVLTGNPQQPHRSEAHLGNTPRPSSSQSQTHFTPITSPFTHHKKTRHTVPSQLPPIPPGSHKDSRGHQDYGRQSRHRTRTGTKWSRPDPHAQAQRASSGGGGGDGPPPGGFSGGDDDDEYSDDASTGQGNDPSWDSNDRDGFHVPPNRPQVQEQNNQIDYVQGTNWKKFDCGIGNHNVAIYDEETRNIKPWLAPRPPHANALNHPIDYPQQAMDRDYFTTGFRHAFDARNLKTFTYGIPAIKGETALAFFQFYQELATYCYQFNGYIPPLHTLRPGNEYGEWFDHLPPHVRVEMEHSFSGVIRSALMSNKTKLMDIARYESIIRSSHCGYRILQSLATINGHPLLNSLAPVVHFPHQGSDMTFSQYVQKWHHHIIFELMQGVVLSDRYFAQEFLAGLHPRVTRVLGHLVSLDLKTTPRDEALPLEYAPHQLPTTLMVQAGHVRQSKVLELTPREFHKDLQLVRNVNIQNEPDVEHEDQVDLQDDDFVAILNALGLDQQGNKRSCFLCQSTDHPAAQCPVIKRLQNDPRASKMITYLLQPKSQTKHVKAVITDTDTDSVSDASQETEIVDNTTSADQDFY